MKITKTRLKEIVREELMTERTDKINYKALPEAIVDYIVDNLDSKKVEKHFTKWDFPKDTIRFNDRHITTYGNQTNIAVSTPEGMKDLEITVKLKR
jgi:hypothetical protein